jgi:hypothetical protein
MAEPTPEEWFYIIGTSLFFVSAFFNVLFFRISVMYIERELEKGGFELPQIDKKIGARGMMYNQLILFKIKNHPFVDDQAVLRFTRKTDWWLAFLSFYSFLLCIIVIGTGYFLYVP